MAHKTGKKKGTFIAMVLLLAATGLFVYIVLLSYGDDELHITVMDETNTKEFAAIVQRVEFENDGVNIYIEGYDWYLSSGAKVREKDLRKKFKTLKPGERVYYRVADWYLKVHPDFPDGSVNFYTEFFALRTETEEIMSLDDYNRIMRRGITTMRIFGFSVAALTFGGACYCVWKLCKKDRKYEIESEPMSETTK